MVRKVDYMKHILKTVCRFNDDDGISPKEITERVRRIVKQADPEEVRSEVRKALLYGMKNNLLKREKGRYKLKLSTLRKRSSGFVFIPLDNAKRPFCATCCKAPERNSDLMMQDKLLKADQMEGVMPQDGELPGVVVAARRRGRRRGGKRRGGGRARRSSKHTQSRRRRSSRGGGRRRQRQHDATPKPEEAGNVEIEKQGKRMKSNPESKSTSQTTVVKRKRSAVSSRLRKDVTEPKKQMSRNGSDSKMVNETQSVDAPKNNDSSLKTSI